MEFRKAAARDAKRAELMRRAAALLRECAGVMEEWDIEGRTVAIAGCVYELEQAAAEATEDALIEHEDTDPYGMRLP